MSNTAQVPSSGTVVIYGEHHWEPAGVRLVEHLHALGFGDVRILSGGFAAWRDLGFPVEAAHHAPEQRP